MSDKRIQRRLAAILAAVAAFGFGVSAATVLSSKYLQTAHGYTPGQVTLLFIPGGLIGLVLTILTGRLSDRIGRKPVTLAVVTFAAISFVLFYAQVPGFFLPPLWVLSFFGFFAGDALLAGLIRCRLTSRRAKQCRTRRNWRKNIRWR